MPNFAPDPSRRAKDLLRSLNYAHAKGVALAAG